MFRVEVISSDGENCGVPVQVDDHPGEARPYAVRQVADSLLIRREEIDEVLDRGTRAELHDHLRQYTKEELKPWHFRKEQAERRAFWGDDDEEADRPAQ